MEDTLKRDNHFVPKFYLNEWKNKNGKVFEYNKIAPSEKSRIWNEKSTTAVCYIRNFYVQKINGVETDYLERIFDKNYEDLAEMALKKAINGERLTPNDWEKIINLIASQIFRTPSYYIKIMQILEKTFEETMSSIPNYIDKHYNKNKLKIDNNDEPILDIDFNIKIEDMNIAKENKKYFRVSLDINKDLYLSCLSAMLENYVQILQKHKWNVVKLDDNVIIPTSDNPVILLNYYKDNTYDLKGGIDNNGGEIIFPISPNKIIYTQIGKRTMLNKFDFKTSFKIKKLILENARNTIISSFKDSEIEKMQPRVVDLEKYKLNQQFIEVLKKE